jgi:hypothetical protein
LKDEIDDHIAGDPMSAKKWIRKSLRSLAEALSQQEYTVGRTTVRRILYKLDYDLYYNHQSLTGPPHPDRDRQFRYINRVKNLFLQAGYPVIRVDTKKKELIGNFKNAGTAWTSQAVSVNAHDFKQDAIGGAVPYGIYDLAHNEGYVYVGTTYVTPEFAAYAIAQWWADPQRTRFTREDKLLILCDAGGSNNCRYWLWKQQIQELLADQFGIEVLICHYPTGASKWNPIEHRLFSQISRNWAGKPLRTFECMLNYIRHTTTQTGLKVKAVLVDRIFEKGRKVTLEQRNALNLIRRPICPNWNYLLKPRCSSG